MSRALAFALAAALCVPVWGDTFHKYGKTFQIGPNPNAVKAVDLNGDGLPEILTANTGNMVSPQQERPGNDEVSFLVATGNLEYVAQPPLRTDFAPYTLAAGNIDNAKGIDVVAGSFMAVHHNDITLFRNVGDNLFEPVAFRLPFETLPYKRMYDGDHEPVFTVPGVTSLILADVNHDGRPDIVATGWSSDVLLVLPGIPETYFGEAKVTSATGGPRDVKAADFDSDGKLDLAVVLYSSSEIGLWKGNGDGTFDAVDRFDAHGRLPTKIEVADINRDGKLDLVVSNCYTDDSVVIFYGDGGFGFSTSQEIQLGKDHGVLEHEIRDCLVADFNGDKKPDIAAACSASRQVAVIINESSDTAIPQRFRVETYPFENARPRALCAADLNKDGAPELVVALAESESVAFLLNTPPKPEPAPAKR